MMGSHTKIQCVNLDNELSKDGRQRDTEQSTQEHDTVLMPRKVEPMLDPLRTDARYAELMRRMHLSE